MTTDRPVASAASVLVEWGLRVNCEKQGCDPKHADDGEVTPRPEKPTTRTVNGHAADLVQRTVTITTWEQPSWAR